MLADLLAPEMLVPILQAAVRTGTPILFVCIGEIYAERAGILNIGLEGMMLVGAIAGFTAAHTIGHSGAVDPTIAGIVGILAAAVVGGLFALIHAFVTITLRADQIVSGITLTILGTGLSGFFGQPMIGKVGPSFERLAIPGLSELPAIGQILFQQDLMVYLSFVLVPISWWVLYKTHLGLSIRSVGESPKTADSLGVDVTKIRYGCVVFGGAMAGIAGIMWGLLFRAVIATTGFLPGIKAFTAAVVGGVGNLGGAMAGGLSLGGAESLAPLTLLEPLGVDGASQLRDAVSFTLLILVLLIKPTGLFGERLSSDDRA